ncbi:MAG: hypothetical protein AAF985_25310 [Bacteroidota bacterium]
MFRIVIICFLALLIGCRGERTSPQPDLPNGTPDGSDSLVNLVAVPDVIKVNFYLENSHSMGGYYGHASRFYENVDGLITDLMIDGFDLYTNTIAESVEEYSSPEDFRTALNPTNDTQIAIGKSSPLGSILQQVFEKSNTSELNILVTDGIISGSNEQIEDLKRKNKDYNLEYISSLVNDIKLGLSPYIDQFETKIYAFKSDFEASRANPYYKLNNSKVTKGVFPNRPYYILVIGTPEVMDVFEQKYARKITAEQVLEFGFIPRKDEVAKLTRFAITNACRVDGERLIFEEGRGSYKFSLLLDLDDFPSQYQDSEFLSETMELRDDQDDVLQDVLLETYALKELPGDLSIFRKDSRLNKEIKGYTHVVTASLGDIAPASLTELKLVFKKDYHNWYQQWSSPNDLDIDFNDNKTFGFEHFVSGIIQAYGGLDQPIYEKRIKVETH